MNLRQRPALVVGTAALATALALAGCSHRTDQDAASTGSAPTTNPAAIPGAVSPDALPKEFPADIPIVDGGIVSDSIDVPGSRGKIWTLVVTGIDATAPDTAEQLLRDAGFAPVKDPPAWSGAPCDREAQLSKETAEGSTYVAHLCGTPVDDQYQLEYTVNVYPKDNWQLPQLPEMPTMPTMPELPELPAPPEPPR